KSRILEEGWRHRRRDRTAARSRIENDIKNRMQFKAVCSPPGLPVVSVEKTHSRDSHRNPVRVVPSASDVRKLLVEFGSHVDQLLLKPAGSREATLFTGYAIRIDNLCNEAVGKHRRSLRKLERVICEDEMIVLITALTGLQLKFNQSSVHYV